MGPTKAHRLQSMLNLMEIKDKVVAPQGSALSHRGKLRGLKVRETDRGEIPPLIREPGQCLDDPDQAIAQQAQRFAHEDQVGVIGDKAARRTQMDDVLGRGTSFAISTDVRHDIMTELLFESLGAREVDVIDMGTQFCQLSLGNAWCDAVVLGKAQLVLSFSEGHPEPAPAAEFALGPP